MMSAAMMSLMMVFMDRSAHLVQQASPAGACHNVSGLGLVRPVNHKCPALYVIARQEPPIPAVLRVVPVVAHYKVMFRRNGHRTVVFSWIAAQSLPIAPRLEFLRDGRGLLQIVGIWLVEQGAIH